MILPSKINMPSANLQATRNVLRSFKFSILLGIFPVRKLYCTPKAAVNWGNIRSEDTDETLGGTQMQ